MDPTALDHHLTEAQRELLDSTQALARLELAPLCGGAEGQVNRPLVRALGDTGLLGRLFVPDDAGGWAPEVSALDLCLIREGLARVSTEAETAFAVQGLGSFPILQSGRPEVIAAWMPQIASGEAVAAFALSEPGAGSDAAALALRADRDGDVFRLTGEKTWISNAPDADVYTVFARTTEGAGARGVTAFCVPRETPGLSGEPLALVSPHAIGRLTFADAVVPPTTSSARRTAASGWRCAPWTSSAQRRGVRGRDGPGGARRRGGARDHADGLRQAAGRAAGAGPPAGGRRHRAGRGAAARPPGRAGLRQGRAARHPGRGHGQAPGHGDRSGGRRPGGPGPRRRRAAAGPPARAPVPRRARARGSTRAPRRSSARSSPAPC
jgi:alkylation response protein AidB-like acyl-CoA dehydrogenase